MQIKLFYWSLLFYDQTFLHVLLYGSIIFCSLNDLMKIMQHIISDVTMLIDRDGHWASFSDLDFIIDISRIMIPYWLSLAPLRVATVAKQHIKDQSFACCAIKCLYMLEAFPLFIVISVGLVTHKNSVISQNTF